MWSPCSQSDHCCYLGHQGSKDGLCPTGFCREKPPVLEKGTPWDTRLSPTAHQGLSASVPRAPRVPMATHAASHSLLSSGTARACAFGFLKVPDLPNLLTPRNLLLPLGALRTRKKGLSKPFVESTWPLKEEKKSTQPSLHLQRSRAKSGAFQIRHRRCFDSKAVSVDYSTGTGCYPGHPGGKSSSPALGAAAGDSSAPQTSPTHMQAALAALFGFLPPP